VGWRGRIFLGASLVMPHGGRSVAKTGSEAGAVPKLEVPSAMQDDVRGAWHRYIDLTAPLRAVLHGYCRRLTGNLWDAEDLVQDTLLRGFGFLGHVHHEIQNPRAYLLRTATNLWIDKQRRREREAVALDAHAAEARSDPPPPGTARDVGVTVMQRLAPQERAAVVLKDLFDAPLDEIALVLGTSVGAEKSALHRGRARLREAEGDTASQRPRPSAALVDRFVAAYNASDKDGLIALMLDGGQIENVGCGMEFGRDQFPREDGWFHRAVYGHSEWPPEFQYDSTRLERALYDGEPIALGLVVRRGREALEQVLRIEESDDGIARLRGYAFCPETMREVGETLGLRVRTGLYRYPTPAPGVKWETG
jgi:RNA polymerase sigma-70 factor (ECF subfamily)